VRVISFENYSVDTVGAQIKAVDMPDEFSERPRILLLACENDAYPALDMAGLSRTVYSAFVRAIPVRCLGSVNAVWISDALSSGYDGVMMMGCKKGDDYQCHFVKGSELAHYRMGKIGRHAEADGAGDRARRHLRGRDHRQRPRGEADHDYAAQIKEIGMSPMKGSAEGLARTRPRRGRAVHENSTPIMSATEPIERYRNNSSRKSRSASRKASG